MKEQNYFLRFKIRKIDFLFSFTDVIRSSSGAGSVDFLKQIYETSGFCLRCGIRSCEPSEDQVVDFGASALNENSGTFSCAASGQPIRFESHLIRFLHLNRSNAYAVILAIRPTILFSYCRHHLIGSWIMESINKWDQICPD